MSHTRQHIIISGLVATGQFDADETRKLEEIGEKSGRCSSKDALLVAEIVRRKLRQPDEHE